MPGGMIALEGSAKCFVALTMPDHLDWFLEDIAQYTFLLVLPGTLMPKGSKTTRKHITARSDIGKRIRTATTRPWPITKISYQALQGCDRASGVEGHAELFTFLLATMDEIKFFACGDRKSTRLNSSHVRISYAVFCLNR